MEFEYDAQKSRANLAKHGIDFDEARELWKDQLRIDTVIEHRGERRRFMLARYAGACWVAIYTMRGERVRLISVRRAVREEAAYYDRENNGR